MLQYWVEFLIDEGIAVGKPFEGLSVFSNVIERFDDVVSGSKLNDSEFVETPEGCFAYRAFAMPKGYHGGDVSERDMRARSSFIYLGQEISGDSARSALEGGKYFRVEGNRNSDRAVWHRGGNQITFLEPHEIVAAPEKRDTRPGHVRRVA